MRWRFRYALIVLVLVAVAGCGADTGPAPTGHAASTGPLPAASSGGDWTTYHRDPTRAGRASAAPRASGVRWRARLDGAVYGQPLVVGDRVLAATENDSLYALDRGTGRVLWRAHVGTPVPLSDLPCGNIDPLGITGTPAYDPATGLVFAVAETSGFHHRLVGVDVRTGAVKVDRDIPTPDGQPRYDQQRAALLVTHGRVYVAFGGLFGDCGPYIGSVVAVPTSGRGALLSYRVPTAREGGIWATGGPTLGTDGHTLYVSVGNGAASETGQAYDGSDSVVALDLTLHQVGYFAPRSWVADNAGDLDLGSMAPAVMPGGRILIAGKRGTGYLLRADRLGGVGGQVASGKVCRAFGGPAHRGTLAYLPCIDGGPAAVDVSGDRIRVRWRGPSDADGSPVLGAGLLWVAATRSGRLYGLDPRTGRPVRTVLLGVDLPHFASPTLAQGLVLIGSLRGVVALS